MLTTIAVGLSFCVVMAAAGSVLIALQRMRAEAWQDRHAQHTHEIPVIRPARMDHCAPALVLFSGTTGSGKSTTMSNRLATLCRERPTKVVLTVEEPVEYIIRGAGHPGIDHA